MKTVVILKVIIVLMSINLLIILVACEQGKVSHNDERQYYKTNDKSREITEHKEYYPNGKLKVKGYFRGGMKNGEFFHYDTNGELEALITYSNDTLEGPFKVFYPNGKLKEITYFTKGKPDGWSYEYWENGKKKKALHFANITGGSRTNQFIVFNEAGAVITDSSHFMTIDSRDTIRFGEEISFQFKLEAPFYRSESQMRILVGGFDNKYRLVDSTRTDTVDGEGLIARYTIRPKERGKQYIRGRLDDYVTVQLKNEKYLYMEEEVNIYFTKEYYVK